MEPIVPLDKFGEVAFQFDAKNSWNKSLSELSVEEILNANLINQISPTLIIRELVQELPEEYDSSKNLIVVINVTSNEGYSVFCPFASHFRCVDKPRSLLFTT